MKMLKLSKSTGLILLLLTGTMTVFGQQPANDSHVPLHLLQPDYPVPYQEWTEAQIKARTDVVLNYLAQVTPAAVERTGNKERITDYRNIGSDCQLERGQFRIASYEWGVTYAGALRMTENCQDPAYERYAVDRMRFLAEVAPFFRKNVLDAGKELDPQMRQILTPHALDDAGSVCASMIKAARKSGGESMKPLISNYMDFILNKEMRLKDGTFARNRPQKNTVWLDDMYMALPAMAQYGVYTNNPGLVHETARLLTCFAERMFVPEKNLFRHGWIEDMTPHPAFHWGRANGWAILTMCEVLDVLPASDSLYAPILNLYRRHVSGLAALQAGSGFWHQLLDRNDSYPETSATAIFTYCIAHGINQGWLDARAYGPVAQLGWAAVSTKITVKGEVEGTCVGTGMGFDPAFYYYRPVSAAAAHGYGPVLLAGAEMIRLVRTSHPRKNDSAIQYYRSEQKTKLPIFTEE